MLEVGVGYVEREIEFGYAIHFLVLAFIFELLVVEIWNISSQFWRLYLVYDLGGRPPTDIRP